MIQALHQALQFSVSWECVFEIQSIKETSISDACFMVHVNHCHCEICKLWFYCKCIAIASMLDICFDELCKDVQPECTENKACVLVTCANKLIL